jgi:hypothetical protein
MLDSICLVIMGKIENIERQIEALSPEELAQFRAWFLIDRLVQEARRDHAADKTTPL